jgi:hypothetical protein
MTVKAQGNRAQVAISWTLVRPDGSTVGTVNQANEVAADLLKGPWGDIAFAIADAAGEDVAKLVVGAPQAATRSTR